MKKLTAALAFIFLLFSNLPLTIAQTQKANSNPALSKAQWREDLQYLARELPKRHKNAFHNISREQFEEMVAELDQVIPTLEDYQIVVRMLEIIAKVGDGHTYVHPPEWFNALPVRFYWFGDELRVTYAAESYKEALGARR